MKKRPVILDTDIGDDIDDTWALAMLLKSPELDVRMVLTDYGPTEYRARIAAKMLEVAGRTEVPVGVGLKQSNKTGPQWDWVKDYPFSRYAGKIYEDGVQALVRTIMDSADPITLICIGPVPNIAAALRMEPRIAPKTSFVGMGGSIRLAKDGIPGAVAEHNVAADVQASQKVFSAPWPSMTITPLDTCSLVRLQGTNYKTVCESHDPVARAVIENYRIWLRGRSDEGQTSRLFDTVAIYLAFADDLLKMETLGLRVTDNGFTVEDTKARPVNCATEWKDLPAFTGLLAGRLTT